MGNTKCLLKSLFHDQEYLKLTNGKFANTKCLLCWPVKIMKYLWCILVQYLTYIVWFYQSSMDLSDITDEFTNVPIINTVEFQTNNICFIHWLNRWNTWMYLSKMSNIKWKLELLFHDQLYTNGHTVK